jgi:hypothetical protein
VSPVSPFVYAALGLFLLIGSFGAGWHFGGQSGKLADTRAVATQEAGVIKQAATDTTTINAEAKVYAAAQVDPIAAPVVRVCLYTPAQPVSRTAAAGSIAHAAAELPAPGPQPAVPGPDIGGPLVQDYIEHVCRVKAP